MSHLKGFFKRITGDAVSYDSLNKQPIVDAEVKLNLFKEATSVSVSGLENYVKFITKSFDSQLADKFQECRDLFKKYEGKGEMLNPTISHIMGIVFGKLNDLQCMLASDVQELAQNIELGVLKPLLEYQKEISAVKDSRKELKEAYDKIEQSRQSLEKAKKDVDSAQRSGGQSSRLTMITSSSDATKRMNDLYRLEEKVQRLEKDLDEATLTANEKYDKYTEGLYKRIADECELTNYYLEYLKLQKKYHKQALKRLDSLIPGIKDSLSTYNKKPVFGCSLNEYVAANAQHQAINNKQESSGGGLVANSYVSPVIRKLIEAMCKQNVFQEEGIFRIAGSRIKMNCLIYAINAGYLEHLDLANDYDVHCLSGVLKQYIRELPDSLLCNDYYENWIAAINTPPSNKIEAFKDVLQKLPKANSENLRYLIKFLGKIVENSEKTKMTTTNMGICFGVSLLGSSSSLKTSASIPNLSASVAASLAASSQQQHHITGYEDRDSTSPTNNSIDMNTATNVFDFLLTNHAELFPGEINFLTGQYNGGSSSNGTSNGGNISIIQQIPSLTVKQMMNTTNGNRSNDQVVARSYNQYHDGSPANGSIGFTTPSSNRYSIMISDNSLGELHNMPLTSSTKSMSINNQSNNNSYVASAASALVTPSPSSSFLISKHNKKNSMDSKFVVAGETPSSSLHHHHHANSMSHHDTSPPFNNNSSFTSMNTSSKLANQINASSTISLDTGSSSPKLKSKKQAPAPPKVDGSMSSSMVMQASSTSPSGSLSESLPHQQHSPPLALSSEREQSSVASRSVASTSTPTSGIYVSSSSSSSSQNHSNDLASNNSLLSRITNANLPASTMLGGGAGLSSFNHKNELISSSSSPSRSSSFRVNESYQTSSSGSVSHHNNNAINQQLSKPSVPPPSIPSTNYNKSYNYTSPAPHIGFTLSVLPDTTTTSQASPPYPIDSRLPESNVVNVTPVVHSSLSSTSSSTTASVSLGTESSSPTSQSNNQPVKPPKPVVPRKPAGNMIAQHINKFESGGSSSSGGGKIEDLIDQLDDQLNISTASSTALNKSAHEITFL